MIGLARHKLGPLSLSLLLALLLISGCAFVPQVANLNPEVPREGLIQGGGKVIGLQVLDERPSSELGHRGHGYGAGAKIKSGQIVADVMFRKISEGLANSGFRVQAYEEGMPTTLKAEIRQIEYHSAQGIVTFIISSSSAIKGYCKNTQKLYEQMYRGAVEEDWLVTPFADTNERIINEALSNALKRMFLDRKLLECLAQ